MPIKPPVEIPSLTSLLELWTRLTPEDFWRAMLGTPSEAVFRGLAGELAQLASQADRGIQARFLLPSAIQRSIPAYIGSKANAVVSLQRSGPLEFPLVIAPGALLFQTRRGDRTYTNTSSLLWWPGEGGTKAVKVECEVEGYVGNLEFEANADGTLDLDLLSLVSRDRSNTGATALGGVLSDTGLPDVFSPQVVSSYLQVVSATQPANVSRVMRITGFADPQVENPPGSGQYPTQVTLDPERWDRSPEPVLEDITLATFTDFYTQAWDGSGAVPLFGAVPAAGDSFYFTQAAPFDGLVIDLLSGAGTWTVAWEYWDGGAWVALPDLADPTLGWTQPGVSQISWSIPGDWATIVSPLSGLPWYFVRANLAAVALVTTAPTFRRVSTITTAPLVPDTSVEWHVMAWEADVGLQITEIAQSPINGRDNDLYLLGDNRGIYRQMGEDPETFRQRIARLSDVVSPNAIQRIVNRALQPLGLTGLVADVSSKGSDGLLLYPGLFFDLTPADLPLAGAFDLYQAGDLFPETPGMVMLEADEAWGWFIVLVPYASDGEFGAFMDDGPIITEYPPETLVDALDTAFMDGYPVTYYSLLAGLAGQIDVAKAGGVRWTFARDLLVT